MSFPSASWWVVLYCWGVAAFNTKVGSGLEGLGCEGSWQEKGGAEGACDPSYQSHFVTG